MSCESLERLRLKLKETDEAIVRLLNERASLALRIGEVKHSLGAQVYDPAQEAKVLERLGVFNQGPMPLKALREVFREILSCCRAIQEPLKVAFLGPEGSFSHGAALRSFGQSASFIPCHTIQEVFRAAEKGLAHCAVVPLENSLEGSVKASLDGLVSTPLKVRGELLLRVSHCLLSRAPGLEHVRRVYSHPQGLAQCQVWLRKNLPERELVEVSSTSEGALRAQEDPQGAAVAGRPSAEIYHLGILAEAIEDSPGNTTRFLILGEGDSPPSGNDKTSLVFTVKHSPGSLCRALRPLAQEGVNLLRIESYPLKDRAWEYLFFADVEGHACQEGVKSALELMEEEVTWLRILGSYPKGEETR